MDNMYFHCSDNKIVTIQDDQIFKCSGILGPMVTVKAREGRGMPCLNVSSQVFLRVIQWAANHKTDAENRIGSAEDTNGVSDWDKRFCLANKNFLVDIISAAKYLEIADLFRMCHKWILSIVEKADMGEVGVDDLDLEPFAFFAGVIVNDAPEEVSRDAMMALQAASGSGGQHDDLLKEMSTHNAQLESKLKAKNAQYDFLSLMHDGIQSQKVALDEKYEQVLCEKKNLERKLYDKSVNSAPKLLRECLICGSLLASVDLLRNHLELVHDIK